MIIFRALRHRSFAFLWIGQTISLFGDRIFQVALAWWVVEKTGSTLAMGTVLLFTTAPTLLFLLVGGVIVDRFSRLRLMFLSDLVRGAVVCIIAALATTSALEIWHVYILSLISGFLEAFFQPAYRAAVPGIVPPEDLPSANSLTSLSGQLSGILGPAAGALIMALGGASLAFWIDGASFFISTFILLPILKLSIAPQPTAKPQGMIVDVKEGLTAVLAFPWLWITIGVAGLSNLAYAGPMEVTLPFLIKDHFHAGVSTLGVFFSLSSAGSVLAALWMGRFSRLRYRGLTLYGSWMLIGLTVTAIGLPIPVGGLLAAAFVIGACNTILSLVWTHTLQEFVPLHLLGRVSSVDYLGSYIMLPLGYALGGWAAEKISLPLVFIIGGLLQTLLIALGLLHPKVRRLD